MNQRGTVRQKATDTLSAFFVLFAMLLAGSFGTLTTQAPVAVASQSSPAGAGQGGQHSKPVLSKQQVLVFEGRDHPAPASNDGKSKSFLAPSGVQLPLAASAEAPDSHAAEDLLATAASYFDARAPPVQS